MHPDLAAGVEVVERLGCDSHPVDVRTTEGRLTLTAYVWPDQVERHERLRRALDLAQRHEVSLRRVGAAELLVGLRLVEGATTVVWHSVVRQYLGADEQRVVADRLEELGSAGTPTSPLLHVAMEPGRRAPGTRREMLVTARSWPGGEGRVLGTAHPHGEPVAWEVGPG